MATEIKTCSGWVKWWMTLQPLWRMVSMARGERWPMPAETNDQQTEAAFRWWVFLSCLFRLIKMRISNGITKLCNNYILGKSRLWSKSYSVLIIINRICKTCSNFPKFLTFKSKANVKTQSYLREKWFEQPTYYDEGYTRAGDFMKFLDVVALLDWNREPALARWLRQWKPSPWPVVRCLRFQNVLVCSEGFRTIIASIVAGVFIEWMSLDCSEATWRRRVHKPGLARPCLCEIPRLAHLVRRGGVPLGVAGGRLLYDWR